MKLHAAGLRLSATDLSNHLSCRHLTSLDLEVQRGQRPEPKYAAPHLIVIRELGKQHEAAYLDYLAREKRLAVTNLADIGNEKTLLDRDAQMDVRGC